MKPNRIIAKTFTFAAVAALVLSFAPTARAQDRGCSNMTLQGTYAQRYTGFAVSGPAVSASAITPIANVVALTFDGHGGVTGAGAAKGTGWPTANLLLTATLRQLHLNLIDGSKPLRGGVRKYCGDSSPILRYQLHKRRNIVGHFADEEQSGWDRRLATPTTFAVTRRRRRPCYVSRTN